MKSMGTSAGLLVALLLLPAGANALSFGSFAPGEHIMALDIGGGTASYNGAGQLTVTGWITSITTDQQTIDSALDLQQLQFSIVMTKVSEFNLPGAFASATYTSAGSDLILLDTLGIGQIYAGDYDPELVFSANEGGTLTGTLGGAGGTRAIFNTDFGQGDAEFEAAMGPTGDTLINLADFGTNTVCGILVACFPGAPQGAWSASATGSIDPPVPAPEPGPLALVGGALGALAIRRRKA